MTAPAQAFDISTDEGYLDLHRRAMEGLSPTKKAEYEERHLSALLPCEIVDDGYRQGVKVPSLSEFPRRHTVIRDWQAPRLTWRCGCVANRNGYGATCHHIFRAQWAWERYEQEREIGFQAQRARLAKRYAGCFRTVGE